MIVCLIYLQSWATKYVIIMKQKVLSVLLNGLFTTAAIDNIDHNPSSTSSHDSFHGTGISLFQHPADTFAGLDQVLITNDADDIVKGKRKHLPESYTSVPPATLPRQDLQIPRQNGPNKADGNLIPQARTKECR